MPSPAVLRRLTPALVAGSLLVATVGSAGAAAGVPRHTSQWRSVRAGVLARVDRVAAALADASLAGAVRAAAAQAGVQVSAPSLTGSASMPAGVPAPIAGAVARVLGAVQTASSMARTSFNVDLRTLDRSVRRMDRLAELVTAHRFHASSEGARARRLHALEHRVRGSFDRTRMYSAGYLVADAIDRALPILQEYAGTLPDAVSAIAVDGCDVLDATPVLCIGNDKNNVYTNDEALQIDLGGDGLYENSAGGAFVLGNSLAAAVTIDLAGNDRYQAQQPLASGVFAVQGGTNYGIGMLVDQAGDDVYAATSGEAGNCAPCTAGAHGQGYAAQGVGLLRDMAGNDTYVLSASKRPGAAAEGQGYAGLGLGLALDYGAGSDSRTMQAASGWAALSSVYGFGYGRVGGVALSYDDGGSDSFTMNATSDQAPGDAGPTVSRFLSGYAMGMGYGDDGGVGMQITGVGPTQRIGTASTLAELAGAVGVFGMGYGDSSGGLGALRDEGGDDLYRGVATSQAVVNATSDDTCGCDGPQIDAEAVDAQVRGMGQGDVGSAGVLVDNAGNDRYEEIATSSATAVARDDRSSVVPGDTGLVANAMITQPVSISGQGFGNGGIGMLDDLGGDDVYRTATTSTARADASARVADVPLEGDALTQQALTYAQGLGLDTYGELRDEGGNDQYSSTNTSTASATPATAVSQGQAVSSVQGMILGLGSALLLDDGGSADVFAQTPVARAPCQGTRGGTSWVDCGAGGAVGVNR
ncbi:MAG: hypothetical protein ABR600_01315 [Actinomycetota bacterium]